MLTTQNGTWADQYSMWASKDAGNNSYAVYSPTYPNATIPNTGLKTSDAILLAPTGRYAFGWDTIRINDINISGYKDLSVGFGLCMRDAHKSSHEIFVSYNVDGGTWTTIDTTTYKNWPGAGTNHWYWVTTPKISSISGSKMSVIVRTMTSSYRLIRNGDGIRYYFDDLTFSGSII